jgi:hypothetical protein
MSWTTPATAVAGTVLTASWLNTYLKDNMLAMLGQQWFYVDGTALRPDLTNGCGAPTDQTLTAGNPLLSGPSFSGTVDQFAQFKIALPKRWDAGTIQYRVRWSAPPANTATGNVIFYLQGRANSDGDSIDGAFGTAVAVGDAFQSVKKHHVTGLSAPVTLAGSPVKGDCAYFVLQRGATNGADTKGDAVVVEGVELFITIDTVNDA